MQFSSSQLLTIDLTPNSQVIRGWCDEIQLSLASLFETGHNSIDYAALLHFQYLVVTNSGSAMLYHQLSQEIDSKVAMIKDKLDSTPSTIYIQTLSATWKHYLFVIDSLRSFCPHLEQTFVSPGQFYSLSDYAFNRWHHHILSNVQCLNTISDVLLRAFNEAREADGVLPPYVSNLASMLTLLDPLANSVSTYFIEDRYIQDIALVCGTRRTRLILSSQQATADFQKTVAELAQKNPSLPQDQIEAQIENNHSYVIDYCRNVELWVAQEMALCQQVLSPSACQLLKSLLMEEFVSQADAILIEDPFDGLLFHFKQHNPEHVKLIYGLLMLNSTDVSMISDEIRALIKEEAGKIIIQANRSDNPVIFVNSIYSLFNHYIQIIQYSCMSNAEMLVSVQSSIETVVGGSSSAPRLLSLYIDQLVRVALQTLALTNMTQFVDPGKESAFLALFNTVGPTIQTAPTYASTLDPNLLATVFKLNPNIPQAAFQSALQARHRVFYELEINIQKWLELTRCVMDKDLYEENHRMLAVERLLSNIHGNYGYRQTNMTLEGLSVLFGPTPPTSNGGLNGAGSNDSVSSFPSLSLGNAVTTAISQGVVNAAPNQANAAAHVRFLQGLSNTTAITPAVSGLAGEHVGPRTNGGGSGRPFGTANIFDQTSPLKLFICLSRNPNIPIFILLEYYLCGKLASPQGPQIPSQQFEALLRDVATSAGLHLTFTEPLATRTSIYTRWNEYVTAVQDQYNSSNGDNDTEMNDNPPVVNPSVSQVVLSQLKQALSVDQIDLRNGSNPTAMVPMPSHKSGPMPKSLYPFPADYGALSRHKFPTLTPLIVTQGVWNSSISPLIPTDNTAVAVSTRTQAEINAQLLKTAHILYPTLKIPFEVLTLLNLLQESYTSRITSRKLVWNYAVSTAVITASFRHPELGTVKSYDIVCSFFQLLILSLFNYKEVYSYAELILLTGIINPAQLHESTVFLQSALLALCHPKVALLLKSPNTPNLDSSVVHQFTWNHSFSHSAPTFTIPRISNETLKHLAAASNATGNKVTVVQDGSSATHILSTNNNPSQQTLFRRETAVDAAIVRIMKHAKEMTHAALVQRVKTELAQYFTPDDGFIKQRIEQQIDQFNIERDSSDRKLYRYL